MFLIDNPKKPFPVRIALEKAPEGFFYEAWQGY
jgi:hypothetical protein